MEQKKTRAVSPFIKSLNAPRRSRGVLEPGPSFSATFQQHRLSSLDEQRFFEVKLYPKIDRGFFLADSDWTCYRRNYFQVSTTFTILDPAGRMVDLPCRVQIDGMSRQVTGFLMNAAARTATGNREIELIQHTAKRDKGPQFHVEPQTCVHQSEFHSFQNVTFQRIQFKTATANNGKRRAAQQYHILIIELLARLDGHGTVRIASSESTPLVVRGRAPGHYDKPVSQPPKVRKFPLPDRAASASQTVAVASSEERRYTDLKTPALPELPSPPAAAGYTYAYSTPHPADPTGSTMIHYYQPLNSSFAFNPGTQFSTNAPLCEQSLWSHNRLPTWITNYIDPSQPVSAIRPLRGSAPASGDRNCSSRCFEQNSMNPSQHTVQSHEPGALLIFSSEPGQDLVQLMVSSGGAVPDDYAPTSPGDALSNAMPPPFSVMYTGFSASGHRNPQTPYTKVDQANNGGFDFFGQRVNYSTSDTPIHPHHSQYPVAYMAQAMNSANLGDQPHENLTQLQPNRNHYDCQLHPSYKLRTEERSLADQAQRQVYRPETHCENRQQELPIMEPATSCSLDSYIAVTVETLSSPQSFVDGTFVAPTSLDGQSESPCRGLTRTPIELPKEPASHYSATSSSPSIDVPPTPFSNSSPESEDSEKRGPPMVAVMEHRAARKVLSEGSPAPAEIIGAARRSRKKPKE